MGMPTHLLPFSYIRNANPIRMHITNENNSTILRSILVEPQVV